MDSKTKDLLQSLSLKTVKNGATLAEEQSARVMISKILSRHNVKAQPQNTEKEKIDYVDLYEKYKNSTFSDTVVIQIDWDYIAKRYLVDKLDYETYVYETHYTWDAYNSRKAGLDVKTIITLQDYRKKCFKVFSSLSREKLSK